MLSQINEKYDTQLAQSLKANKLDTNKQNTTSTTSIYDFDQAKWASLLKKDDSCFEEVVDQLLKLSKQPIINEKELDELRESTSKCNGKMSGFSADLREKKPSHSDENPLCFKHSSTKSMAKTDVVSSQNLLNLENRSTTPNNNWDTENNSISSQKEWVVSPIKNNVSDTSENQADKTDQTRTSAAGEIYLF